MRVRLARPGLGLLGEGPRVRAVAEDAKEQIVQVGPRQVRTPCSTVPEDRWTRPDPLMVKARPPASRIRHASKNVASGLRKLALRAVHLHIEGASQLLMEEDAPSQKPDTMQALVWYGVWCRLDAPRSIKQPRSPETA